MRENLSAYCLWILPLLIFFKVQQIFLFPSMRDNQKYQTLNDLDMSLHKNHRLLFRPSYIVLFEYPYELLKKKIS